jgi:hypothetical protein
MKATHRSDLTVGTQVERTKSESDPARPRQSVSVRVLSLDGTEAAKAAAVMHPSAIAVTTLA